MMQWFCDNCKREQLIFSPNAIWLKDNPSQQMKICNECHHKLTREKRIAKEAKYISLGHNSPSAH